MISGKKSYAEILDTLSGQQEPQQLQSFQQSAHSTILKEQRIQAANLSTQQLQTASQMHQNQQNINEVPQSDDITQNVSNNQCEFDDLWSDLSAQVSNMRLSDQKQIQNRKNTKEANNKRQVNKNKKQGNKLLKTRQNLKKTTSPSLAEGMVASSNSSAIARDNLNMQQQWQQQPSVENSSITSSLSDKASRKGSLYDDDDVKNSDHIQTKDQTNRKIKNKNKKHQFAFHNLPPIAHTVENLFLKSEINNPLLDEAEDDSSPDSNAPTMQDSLEPSSRSLSSKSASTEEQCENTTTALDTNNDAVASNEVVDQNNNSVNDILTILLGPNHQVNPQNEESPAKVKQSTQKVNADQDLLQRTYFEKAQYFVAPKGNQVPALF